MISLALGLGMSILLFARVAYEQSYDTCFRDYNRIYQVWSIFLMEGENPEPQTMNMGPGYPQPTAEFISAIRKICPGEIAHFFIKFI